MCDWANTSVLGSAVLACAYAYSPSKVSQRPGVREALAIVQKAKEKTQLICVVLLFVSASSLLAPIYAVQPFGDLLWGGSKPSFSQRLALFVALTVWRAEKLESLLQRADRAASSLGAPYLWCTDGATLWGLSRRAAVVVVCSCGSGPFLKIAFPAVVIDEFLEWCISEVKAIRIRPEVTVEDKIPKLVGVLISLFDMGHLAFMIVNVFALVLEYPVYSQANPIVLTSCAIMWTCHNLHLAHSLCPSLL